MVLRSKLGPVGKTDRIVSLDVLRGFAVLGMLVMNIQAFSMVTAAYFNPTAFGNLSGANYWVWLLSYVFVYAKFRAIFAMLFGAGILLMASRAQSRGLSPAGLHYRRMGWLAIIGILHAYLLWAGDILYLYGVCGSLVFLLRKLPPARLFLLGILLLVVPTGISLAGAAAMQTWSAEQLEEFSRDNWRPTPEMIERQIDVYQGSWTEQMELRAPLAFFLQTFVLLISRLWEASGYMLIGMALFKLSWFQARLPARLYLLVLLAALGFGLPLVLYGVQRNFAVNWDVTYSFFLGPLPNTWASVLVALGWTALAMLVCKTPGARGFTRPLAAVGQMALSNYLLQTAICTTLFYGHGLGLFGQVSRVEQIQIVAAIWVFQLLFSPLWLRYFRFGPFEWAWRSLTYRKRQPLLIA